MRTARARAVITPRFISLHDDNRGSKRGWEVWMVNIIGNCVLISRNENKLACPEVTSPSIHGLGLRAARVYCPNFCRANIEICNIGLI